MGDFASPRAGAELTERVSVSGAGTLTQHDTFFVIEEVMLVSRAGAPLVWPQVTCLAQNMKIFNLPYKYRRYDDKHKNNQTAGICPDPKNHQPDIWKIISKNYFTILKKTYKINNWIHTVAFIIDRSVDISSTTTDVSVKVRVLILTRVTFLMIMARFRAYWTYMSIRQTFLCRINGKYNPKNIL